MTDREHLPLERSRALAAICEQMPAFELMGGDLGEACDAVIDALPLGVPSGTCPGLWRWRWQ